MKRIINIGVGCLVTLAMLFMFMPIVNATSYQDSITSLHTFIATPYTHSALEYELHSDVTATTGSSTSFNVTYQKATAYHYYYAVDYHDTYQGVTKINNRSCHVSWLLNIADMKGSVYYGTKSNTHYFPI